MAMTNVELYEALRKSIPEEAARLIAEGYPRAVDQATKVDIAGVIAEIASVRREVGSGIASLRTSVAGLQAEVRSLPTMRWTLGLFVPMWLGVWATVVAVVLKG